MNKEEILLSKRFVDLSKQAKYKGIVTFSDFLNLNELNILNQTVHDLYCDYVLFGGYEFSERQMVSFNPDALSVFDYPIVCIKIQPKNIKFSEKLTHRDVLGSLMHLGIERSKIGDILLNFPEIYVFCNTTIKEYILEQLICIKHTPVTLCLIDFFDITIKSNLERKEGIVASDRLDCLVSCMLNISRKEASSLIKKGSVFISNKEIINISHTCKKNDLISIRSFGRFRYLGELKETKKGKIKIHYDIFK